MAFEAPGLLLIAKAAALLNQDSRCIATCDVHVVGALLDTGRHYRLTKRLQWKCSGTRVEYSGCCIACH
jgi:hypothetical protein